jgi:hypothetical protein
MRALTNSSTSACIWNLKSAPRPSRDGVAPGADAAKSVVIGSLSSNACHLRWMAPRQDRGCRPVQECVAEHLVEPLLEVPRRVQRGLDIDEAPASHEVRSPESEGDLRLKETRLQRAAD